MVPVHMTTAGPVTSVVTRCRVSSQIHTDTLTLGYSHTFTTKVTRSETDLETEDW